MGGGGGQVLRSAKLLLPAECLQLSYSFYILFYILFLLIILFMGLRLLREAVLPD